MAAPVGHLTIKFNSIKFNSLGLLMKEYQVFNENKLEYIYNDKNKYPLTNYSQIHRKK